MKSKKTTLSARSALPQALAHLMASAGDAPLLGLLANGDDVLFIKVNQEHPIQYALSCVSSLYVLPEDAEAALRMLKSLSQKVMSDER